MRATPGCIEHHLKFSPILAEAKKRHKSLTVAWLDLGNVYVYPSFIDRFALHHYLAPSHFCNVVASIYSLCQLGSPQMPGLSFHFLSTLRLLY